MEFVNEYKTKRVQYRKSPLIEVIIQFRFPAILSINNTIPATFQDKIRNEYPFFQEQTEELNNINIELNPQVNSAQIRKTAENKNYSFISTDNKTKINLTPSFIAVSTMEYSCWENFKEKVLAILAAFEEVYHPAFYSRIGLRYINAITRTTIGLGSSNWADLIEPHILGMMAYSNEAGVKSYISEIEYKTKIEGVISKTHTELVNVNNQPELSMLIDCDYYKMGITAKEEAADIADNLHRASSHFLQDAIKEKLHQAMDPVEIK